LFNYYSKTEGFYVRFMIKQFKIFLHIGKATFSQKGTWKHGICIIIKMCILAKIKLHVIVLTAWR